MRPAGLPQFAIASTLEKRVFVRLTVEPARRRRDEFKHQDRIGPRTHRAQTTTKRIRYERYADPGGSAID